MQGVSQREFSGMPPTYLLQLYVGTFAAALLFQP